MTEKELNKLREKIGYTFQKHLMKDKMQRTKTLSLFKETMKELNGVPVFTLKGYDYDGLPSMRRLYVELEDPTEYLQAKVLLGSWEHWQKLTRAPWFVDNYLSQWRDELEVKLRSKGIKSIIAKDSLQARKYLADAGWKSVNKVGRTTKKQIERKANIKAKVLSSIDMDALRLGVDK